MAKWLIHIAPAVSLAVAFTGASPALAQQTVMLRGAVLAAETGERLPFALIRLDPGYDRQFANEDGVFAIAGIPAASYRLIIRQVGYQPFDTTVTVDAGTPSLRIVLSRLVVELGGLEVSGRQRCRQPGPPTQAARAELVRVFEQLTLNAQQHALLLERYPFYSQMERERARWRRGGTVYRDYDTLVYRSDHRWRYTPGRVVDDDPNSSVIGNYIVRFPTLADLADSLFQATHCFRLAGLDTLAGGPWIRVDFRVSEAIHDPDVDGSVFLDPQTYQVRRTLITVTRVSRAVRDARAFSAVAHYREVRPNLLIAERVMANTHVLAPMERSAVVLRTERKRLLQVAFVQPASRQDTVPSRVRIETGTVPQ